MTNDKSTPVAITLIGDNEEAQIFGHGHDDYEIYFVNADFSVRGTLTEILDELTKAINGTRGN